MRIPLILLVVVILAASVQVAGSPVKWTMRLSAHPQAIVADGRSETTISAQICDQNGKFVDDGTTVDFTSSIGIIEPNAKTESGVARVRLQSAVTLGTAIVSAVVTSGNAVGQIKVDFLEPGTQMFSESFITVSSKNYLGYDVNKKLIDSAGGVTIAARGLTISAEEAQIDLESNVLRAKCKMGVDNIIIKRDKKTIEASALYYDFNSMSGFILTPADNGAKRVTFRGRDLFTEPATKDTDKTKSLDYAPISQASMFIKARSLVVRPGEEVKFKKASFYMDGTRMMNIPLYVVNLHGDNGGADQMLNYGTDGVRLNIPFYYSLTPNSTGALRIEHGDSTGLGSYSGKPGWELNLEQDYNYNAIGSTEGAFELNRITSPSEWGARWTQRKEFDNNSQVYNYIDFPSHNSLYSSVNYSRMFPNYTFSINSRASKVPDADGTFGSDAYIRSRAKPLFGGALNYSMTSKFSVTTNNNDHPYGTGAGLQLYSRPVTLNHLGTLNSSLVMGQNWGLYGGSTLSANTGLNHSINKLGSLGLNYSYSWGNSGLGYSTHILSANLYLTPSSKLNISANASRGLSDRTTSLFGSLGYALAPTWYCGLNGNYYWKSGSYSYTDTDYFITKAIGKQQMSIIWSTFQKRFRVEFSALHF